MTTRRRLQIALIVLGVAALIAGLVLLTAVAGAADREYRVWELGQTLAGAFPQDPPADGTLPRVLGGISLGLGAVALIGAWIAAGSTSTD